MPEDDGGQQFSESQRFSTCGIVVLLVAGSLCKYVRHLCISIALNTYVLSVIRLSKEIYVVISKKTS